MQQRQWGSEALEPAVAAAVGQRWWGSGGAAASEALEPAVAAAVGQRRWGSGGAATAVGQRGP